MVPVVTDANPDYDGETTEMVVALISTCNGFSSGRSPNYASIPTRRYAGYDTRTRTRIEVAFSRRFRASTGRDGSVGNPSVLGEKFIIAEREGEIP
ncbi:hypothetical protein ACFFQF_13225 [Haladaptatus pallidirubidus]|uniref:hypothetical protein n=1 Tax=Haladaptatus pallidirubidus TaxID=1008152 RepID=UPI001D12C7E9|nr:hypothetical protein [Haladaptatus pallidirubidus]